MALRLDKSRSASSRRFALSAASTATSTTPFGKAVRGKLSERGGASPALLVQYRSTLLDDLPVILKKLKAIDAIVK